jgi:hypothetical protein
MLLVETLNVFVKINLGLNSKNGLLNRKCLFKKVYIVVGGIINLISLECKEILILMKKNVKFLILELEFP